MSAKISISVVLILAVFPVAAFAQAPPTPSTPSQQTAPPNAARGAQQTNCAPTQAVPSEGTIAPRGNSTTGQSSEPLSDKLAKSDGTLCPPTDVDPQMHAPAPNTGAMPVIPPPGSPGGDPSVRPK